jgi:hypothetical protein
VTAHLLGCRWSGGLCSLHGCPDCFLADDGECEACSLLIGPAPYPDPACIDGDDCIFCMQCWRCKCHLAVCRECQLCFDHVERNADAGLDCLHTWWDAAKRTWTWSDPT